MSKTHPISSYMQHSSSSIYITFIIKKTKICTKTTDIRDEIGVIKCFVFGCFLRPFELGHNLFC